MPRSEKLRVFGWAIPPIRGIVYVLCHALSQNRNEATCKYALKGTRIGLLSAYLQKCPQSSGYGTRAECPLQPKKAKSYNEKQTPLFENQLGYSCAQNGAH